MARIAQRAAEDLAGATVVITRPAGTGGGLARQVRARGGVPVVLPGLALRPPEDPALARAALAEAWTDDAVIFTSPAAVRYAVRLVALTARPGVFAVGQGTARALARNGVAATVPGTRQDSEGLLALPAFGGTLARVALIGAAGGRALLQDTLAARGARVRPVYVYRRAEPVPRARHLSVLAALSTPACVLWSSAMAIDALALALPATAWSSLCSAIAVTSSERIAAAARGAGFERCLVAASAGGRDLLDAASSVLKRR